MCGRYEVIDGQRVYSRFRIAQPMLPIADNGDVRPTQQVVALQADRVLSAMRWGLVPAWAKDPRIGSKMINARSEGIASKISFKRPLRFQRCIIPASAFFEWQGSPGTKVKYRIARKDGELFGFANSLVKCRNLVLQPQMGEDERVPRGDREISHISIRLLVPLAMATSR